MKGKGSEPQKYIHKTNITIKTTFKKKLTHYLATRKKNNNVINKDNIFNHIKNNKMNNKAIILSGNSVIKYEL